LNKFKLIEFTRGAPATQNRATCDIFMTIHHNFVAVAKRKEWHKNAKKTVSIGIKTAAGADGQLDLHA
jgi:hypothetical protein